MLFAFCSSPAWPAEDPSQVVREYRSRHAVAILDELRDFLVLPNVASDRVNIERNADHLVSMLERRGIAARKLGSDGPPAVFGAWDVAGATRTIVFYAHYDGQPVREQDWVSDPWTPVLRTGSLADGAATLDWRVLREGIDDDWRIYARSSSDDKSPIVAMLAAFDALQAAGAGPGVNLRFFFEGEEEAGSPHLEDVLQQHRKLLAADLWIFCDGPVHPDGRGQVVFGVRGALGLEMTVYGPIRALHSGHYGNWAPNPAMRLVGLLGSMRDDDGRILLDGIGERVRPLTDTERLAVERVPDADASQRHELAIARSEAGNARLTERVLLPAMNLRGLRSGGVQSEATNAIPTQAHASIDFRLVPDVGPADIQRTVTAHAAARGYTVVSEEPDVETRRQHPKLVRMQWSNGYPGIRTPMDLPASRAVVTAVETARGEEAIRIPNLGGSLPLHLFSETLNAPLIIVPMVNHDNNQHAPNENVRIGNIWSGIDMYAALMRLEW